MSEEFDRELRRLIPESSKEFNLSKERKELEKKAEKNIENSYYEEFNEGILHCLREIEEQDKEFIRRLKKELYNSNIVVIGEDIIKNKIDKLAGEKLSK